SAILANARLGACHATPLKPRIGVHMHAFTGLFLAFLALGLVLRLWLNWRQVRHVRAHRERVPEAFADAVTLEQHQKAADYTIAKSVLGRWDAALGVVLLLAFTLGGGIA